jgi:hypothetical protein
MRRLCCILVLVAACKSGGKPSPSPDMYMGTPHFGELSNAVVSMIAQPMIAVQVNNPSRQDYFDLSPRDLTVGDLDGDGINDIFVTPTLGSAFPELPVQVWLGKGDGTFALATDKVIAAPVPTTGGSDSVFIADFNGDKRNDVFIVDQGLEYPVPFTGHRNELLLSGSDGLLHDASATVPPTYNGFNHVSSMGDVDGNGCPDVIVTNLGLMTPPYHGTYILYSDCKGGFTKSQDSIAEAVREEAFPFTAGVDYQNTGTNTTADLDGDGQPELVTACYRIGDQISKMKTVRVHKQDKGTFTLSTTLLFPPALASVPYFPGGDPTQPDGGLGCSGLYAGDLDGDKQPEILAMWEGVGLSTMQIFHNDGNLAFHDVTLTTLGSYDTTFMASNGQKAFATNNRLYDVDHDGDLDLVEGMWGGIGAAELVSKSFIYLNDGHGKLTPWRFTVHGAPATTQDVVSAGLSDKVTGIPLVFDANKDGVEDIVLVDNGSHAWPGMPYQTETVMIYTFLAGRR